MPQAGRGARGCGLAPAPGKGRQGDDGTREDDPENFWWGDPTRPASASRGSGNRRSPLSVPPLEPRLAFSTKPVRDRCCFHRGADPVNAVAPPPLWRGPCATEPSNLAAAGPARASPWSSDSRRISRQAGAGTTTWRERTHSRLRSLRRARARQQSGCPIIGAAVASSIWQDRRRAARASGSAGLRPLAARPPVRPDRARDGGSDDQASPRGLYTLGDASAWGPRGRRERLIWWWGQEIGKQKPRGMPAASACLVVPGGRRRVSSRAARAAPWRSRRRNRWPRGRHPRRHRACRRCPRRWRRGSGPGRRSPPAPATSCRPRPR